MRYYATATERVHKLYMLYIAVRVLLPQLRSPYSSLKVSLSAQSQPQTHCVVRDIEEDLREVLQEVAFRVREF